MSNGNEDKPAVFENVPDDSEQVDDESGYESEGLYSDTTSLSSSIRNYVYENGRRYHSYNEGKYVMPNDESEQDRLDLVHHIFLLMLSGELLVAPLPFAPHDVLDLGTGTGIWAIDIADKYPSATVIGNDLSPIQPSWVPPNVKFQIDDFEISWPYPKGSFDLVHARTLSGSVSDWPALHRRALAALKPGTGVFEVQEPAVWAWSNDGTLDDDGYYMQMQRYVDEASSIIGKRMNTGGRQKEWMEAAGFVDVVEKVYMLPFGSWPKNRKLKELGRIQKMQLGEALEPYCLALFSRCLGWKAEEVQTFLDKVKEELKDGKVHAYTKAYFVYGRKPALDEK